VAVAFFSACWMAPLDGKMTRAKLIAGGEAYLIAPTRHPALTFSFSWILRIIPFIGWPAESKQVLTLLREIGHLGPSP
jgi:hypothetical protein